METVYRLRLRGENLEVYNLEWSAKELQKRITEKKSEIARTEEEVERGNHEEQMMQEERMQEELVQEQEEEVQEHEEEEEEEVRRAEEVRKRKREQPESEEARNEREHGLKLHLSVGVLAELHKDAKTIFKCPLVQIVAKIVNDGKLESL